jgi:hypothetical protein
VNEQVAALQTRLRNDPSLEQVARREWAKMCRAIPLGGKGSPDLWLELRPTRAFAAQPRVDANAVTLTVGVQAETRIVPQATKPNCPFPAQLEIVRPMDRGLMKIGVPIDIAFTEVSRLLAAQFKNRRYPEDGSGSIEATIHSAKLAASGDRLLISLRVNAREKKSYFGFGGEVTVHIWGRPVLDSDRQILRFADVVVDVDSGGLLGTAARTALPYLQNAVAESAVVDLKPLMANARANIEKAIQDFRGGADGVRVDASVADVRVVGIEFDATTLRVIGEADGAVRVAVTALP